MANPVSPLRTAFPSLSAPLVDADGLVQPPWSVYFLAMLARTGGTTGADAAAVLITAQAAEAAAALAATHAATAASTATAAASTATAAVATLTAFDPVMAALSTL